MRVHSTYEVNAHQQHNPFIPQDAGSASAGQQTSGLSFAEHLKSHFQQPIPPVTTSDPDTAIAGIAGIAGFFWGFHPALKVQSKPESTRDDSAG